MSDHTWTSLHPSSERAVRELTRTLQALLVHWHPERAAPSVCVLCGKTGDVQHEAKIPEGWGTYRDYRCFCGHTWSFQCAE